jgi:hypothetical protein
MKNHEKSEKSKKKYKKSKDFFKDLKSVHLFGSGSFSIVLFPAIARFVNEVMRQRSWGMCSIS